MIKLRSILLKNRGNREENRMKRKYALIKLSVFCLLIASTLIFIVYNKNNEPAETPVIDYVSPSYVIDVNNLSELVGFCSNVFVGYVEEMTGTNYDASIPRTCYDVTVIDNIKGELPINTKVQVQKSGGLTEDSSSYILFENDSMPSVGKYYIFTVKDSDGDGVYVASGPNTTALINDVDTVSDVNDIPNSTAIDNSQNLEADKLLRDSDIFQKYEKAYQNEIPFNKYK